MASLTIEQAMQIATGHHENGRLAEAEAIYRRVLAQCPDHPDALHLLGALACATGHIEAAMALIDRAIAINPAVAPYHGNLGESLRRSGDLDRALATFQHALQLDPELPEAHNGLGVTLLQMGRAEEAAAACARAIALRSGLVEAHNNLGNALYAQRRLEEACASYGRAIELQPEYAEAFNNLGNAEWDRRRPDAALAAFNRAIVLRPELVEAHLNLGNALRDLGRLDPAVAAYRRAIGLAPDCAAAYNNLGNVLRDQGRLDEALESYRRAIVLQPDFAGAASNLVFALNLDPACDAQAIVAAERTWDRSYAAPLAAEIPPHRIDRTPDRTLKIGFLSPDFRVHPVGHMLINQFLHHDRRRFEYIAYSDVRAADDLTREFRTRAGRWREILGLSDPQVAALVRDDAIDILIDTSQHTANNRLLVFARKPAPIQVTMIGLPISTGLTAIDFRLTDPHLDPLGTDEAAYAERSVRLPRCFACYRPPAGTPAVSGLPAADNGFVTLGCLNQFAKVSRPALRAWLEILRSLPGSRVIIHSHAGSHRDAVRSHFEDGGIAADRVEFAPHVPFLQHFQRYLDLDLSLDPFPFNGHASTLDSLWMGVPVITLRGRTAAGRAGTSLLTNVGLPELIAHSPAEYVAIAVALAGDLPRLAVLRSGLRTRLESSPLMDGARFANDVDRALREIWEAACGH